MQLNSLNQIILFDCLDFELISFILIFIIYYDETGWEGSTSNLCFKLKRRSFCILTRIVRITTFKINYVDLPIFFQVLHCGDTELLQFPSALISFYRLNLDDSMLVSTEHLV